jgi:hypothetical protein
MLAMPKTVARVTSALIVLAFVAAGADAASAQEAVNLAISIRNHKFEPAELHAPANRPIVLRIKNLDSTPAEFESVRLRVEKVIAANGEGVVNLRPLAPGRYEFFDDFHKDTTRGALIVQ